MGLSASQARFLQLTARKSDIEYEVQQINFQRLQLSDKMSAASTKYQDAISNRKLTFSFNAGEGLQEVDISYKNYKNYMNKQLEGFDSSQSRYFLVSSSGNKLVVSSEAERDEIIKKHTTKVPVDEILKSKAKVDAFKNYKPSENTEDGEVLIISRPIPETPTEDDYIRASYYSNSYLSETIPNANGDPVEYCLVQEYTENDFLIAEDLDDTTSFQNAIKNGIYYFATREINNETGEKEFKMQSWDSLGNGAISEVFDKSDDAAAQAEYESTQNKVQSLDKKLELQLDQLETEREAITTEIDSVKKVMEDNVEDTFNIFS